MLSILADVSSSSRQLRTSSRVLSIEKPCCHAVPRLDGMCEQRVLEEGAGSIKEIHEEVGRCMGRSRRSMMSLGAP